MGRLAPICLTLLICDRVAREAGARKVTLVGTFDSITAAVFPVVLPPCSVWIELTAGHGETPLVVRLARDTPDDLDGDTVFESSFTLQFTDPRTIHRHHLSVVGLELLQPEEYRLSIAAFGMPLMERRLEVTRLEEQQR